MTGTVTISIEVELGWGVHDTGEFDRLSQDGSAERRYLAALLSACTRHEIPISFDVVGHLFLSACPGTHASPHSRSWFAADPGTDVRTDPLFYAPDMVRAIRAEPVGHELCTHTFSHAVLDEVTRTVAEWELRRAQEMHREHTGGRARSLVPPRHGMPSSDLLSEHGIETVRPPLDRETGSTARRFKQLLAGPEPLSVLRRRDGIVETYCTTNPSLTAPALPSGQGGTHPAFRSLPEAIRRHLHLRKLRNLTRRAAREDAHAHLWCHLFDLGNEAQWRTVRAYLDWLATYRDRNDLAVVPMAGLNAHLEGDADRLQTPKSR
jgi:hypothetical protein